MAKRLSDCGCMKLIPLYPCFMFAPTILFSSDLQSDPGAVALKRTSPLPPILEPPNHPDNMDGFYDQQVPFMVPPSVSGHTSASNISSPLSTHGCVLWMAPPVATMYHCTFIAHLVTICIVHWEGSGIFCWCSDVFFIFSLPTAQVSCGGIISQQASERQEKEICRHRARPGHRR